eukprot:COSAG01_NODE_1290_length_10882_cov_25.926922_11_plen_208_part_00
MSRLFSCQQMLRTETAGQAHGLNRSLAYFFPEYGSSPLNNSAVERVLEAYPYPSADDPDTTPHFINKYTSIAAAALRDFVFVCASRRAARAVTRGGGRVFMYEWRHDIRHWIDGALFGGNYHASELSFVLANEWPPLIHAFTPADREMSGAIVQRWSALAASSRSPGGGWPAWTEQREEHLQLQLPLANSSFLRAEICESVWDRLPR